MSSRRAILTLSVWVVALPACGGGPSREGSEGLAPQAESVSVTAPDSMAAGDMGGAAEVVSVEWTQWRGADRDGQAVNPTSGAEWPAALATAWGVEVGTGHASPLVSGETVYVFSRRGEEETLTALSLASGEVLWRTGYEAPYRMSSAARAHGKGPKSTPVLAGGRLFTLGISGIVSAFDAVGGELLWQEEYGGRFGDTSPLYGAAMSPLVDGERVFVHVGGNGDGALLALAAASGEEVWSWTGDGPGYASPVIAELDGTRQLVTQVEKAVVGFDVDSGRLLWSVPFETPWVQNAVTPLVVGDLLVYSGLDQGTTAVRPKRSGDAWELREVWATGEVSLYMSSPVRVGERMCGFSHLKSGQHFCLDLANGEVAWTSRGREGDNAALLAAGGRVYALLDDARLVVYRADAERFTPLTEIEVADSPTWAHPVLLPGGLLVKDETRLALLRFP